MNVVEILLLQSLLLFLLAGAAAGLVLGAMLIWRPDRLRALSGVLGRWVSTRRFDRALEQGVATEPWVYRNHRLLALLLLLGAGYVLYVLGFSMERGAAVSVLSSQFAVPAALAGALLDAMVLTSLIGAAGGLVVALFLLQRPSMLREFEQRANRWISLRRALKPAEVQRSDFDDFAFRNARQVGIFLLLGSLYTMALLGYGLGSLA